jgi:hypothetical protein
VGDYERSVFINCPFDPSFEPVFHAIVLTVVARGFKPRCARETEGQAEPRIVRIARGLTESKYSIHDLSRFQGEGPENLSRFNMPLELGMALGIRHLRAGMSDGKAAPEHNWLALVPENFVHQRFISDLAGYDPKSHDQTPRRVIKAVADWLFLQPEFSEPSPSPKTIFDAYAPFTDLIEKAKEQELGTLTWPVVVASAEVIVAEMQLPAN